MLVYNDSKYSFHDVITEITSIFYFFILDVPLFVYKS